MMNNDLDNLGNIRRFIESIPPEIISKPDKTLDNKEFSDEILPFALYRGTRQNVEKIADQINKSFCYGVYDGASVLMRRLTEMLLILTYKEIKQEDKIRDVGGNYLQLSQIITQAINNPTVDLTRNAKEYLRIIKDHGDQSAHNPFYNCTHRDLQNIQYKYRSLIEELLYKSGIRK